MSQDKKKTLGLAVVSLILGCLILFPILGFLFGLAAIILGIIALGKISKDKENFKGRGLAISGIILGAIGVVLIPIIALLSAIAIPNLLRARVNQNEVQAQAVLRMISAGAETYAATEGEYPLSVYSLTVAGPPYLEQDYTHGVHSGYKFSCDFDFSNYKCRAVPEQCIATGTKIYTLVTGGKISEKDCTH